MHLQPLGHLSASLESAVYGRVAQPETGVVIGIVIRLLGSPITYGDKPLATGEPNQYSARRTRRLRHALGILERNPPGHNSSVGIRRQRLHNPVRQW